MMVQSRASDIVRLVSRFTQDLFPHNCAKRLRELVKRYVCLRLRIEAFDMFRIRADADANQMQS